MRIALHISLFFFFAIPLAKSQAILSRNISLNIQNQRLGDVLETIEKQGEFKFSYHSKILPLDSVVNVKMTNLNIAEALDQLLDHRFEYRQAGNFVVIRYAPLELVLLVNESIGNPEIYTIKGQIVDKTTNKPVPDASIYEKHLLVSEISDGNGYFSMRLKNITQPISLTVSKENYKSTISHFLAEVNITNSGRTSERFINEDLLNIENTWLGRALVTTKQKIQSINIGGFISKAPYQFGLVPGLNSHGSLSGQVVNRFSFNAIGAYSAGVDGAEIGLLFNIDKSNVQYFQFGGAFNMVGGNVNGVQIAGLFNFVNGDVRAAQVALGYNHIGKNFEGFQVGGIYNRINRDFRGAQLSLGLNTVGRNFDGFQVGALNLISNRTKGIQIGVGGNVVASRSTGLQIAGIANLNHESTGVTVAALANFTHHDTRGLQIGAINYAGKLRGFQLGIVNISEENNGYSLGLINIAFKGYHKFYFGTNETTDFNFAYKGGSNHFYNILKFGTNSRKSEKLYTGGLGFGTEISALRKISIHPEISSQYVYQGSWAYFNLLHQFGLPLSFKLNKWLSVQGGPSLNVFFTKQNTRIGAFGLLQEKHRDFSFRDPRYSGWIGWSVGINLL